jgi:hypothetical protein
VKGRKSSSGRCVAGAHRGSKCTTYKPAGSSTSSARAGTVSLALTGRLGATALKPGTYRVTIAERTADGRRSSPVTLTVTVVAARRHR